MFILRQSRLPHVASMSPSGGVSVATRRNEKGQGGRSNPLFQGDRRQRHVLQKFSIASNGFKSLFPLTQTQKVALKSGSWTALQRVKQ